MRATTFIKNGYYYVSGSGVGEQKIFLDDYDRAKFLLLITHLQSPIQINNTDWYTQNYLTKKSFRVGQEKIRVIDKERHVRLLSFSITPNSYHLLVENIEEMVLSVYMQRVLTGYSRFFNFKYKRRGHVFSGPFSASLIADHSSLPDTTAHIHRLLSNYATDEWSSYRDYTEENRWPELLDCNVVLNNFKSPDAYKKFVAIYNQEEVLKLD